MLSFIEIVSKYHFLKNIRVFSKKPAGSLTFFHERCNVEMKGGWMDYIFMFLRFVFLACLFLLIACLLIVGLVAVIALLPGIGLIATVTEDRGKKPKRKKQKAKRANQRVA